MKKVERNPMNYVVNSTLEYSQLYMYNIYLTKTSSFAKVSLSNCIGSP